MKDVQVCSKCIMDNKSDDTITFHKDGQCNYCTDAWKAKNMVYFPNSEGREKLKVLIDRIKKKIETNNMIVLWEFPEVWIHHTLLI